MSDPRPCVVCGITLPSFRLKTCDKVCAEARKRKRTRMEQILINENPTRRVSGEPRMNGRHGGYIDRARKGHGYNSRSEHGDY